MLALIVAIAHHRVIGKDNSLIWHLPNDLKFFKEKTTGHVIIMGRKTFESLPFLLPNREHWVITTNKGFNAPEGVRVFSSPEAVVEVMHITEVDHEFEGDAHFPAFDASAFTITSVVEGTVDDKNTYPHRFVTYERKGHN